MQDRIVQVRKQGQETSSSPKIAYEWKEERRIPKDKRSKIVQVSIVHPFGR